MSAPDTMRAPDQLDELLARKRGLDAAAEQTADFAARLRELRAWQTARLENTYRDFRADPRYAAAVEFFLSDLYGPQEFRARDRDLARAWRYLKRALPAAAMAVLGQAIELDVLTLELDHALVRALAAGARDRRHLCGGVSCRGRSSRPHPADRSDRRHRRGS